MKFSDYELRPELLQAIEQSGFTECTPIQDAVMGAILKGTDVSGLAQTGTGKTAAFVIPLIDRILRFKLGESGERVPAHWKKNSYVLVLVPTRELAAQVEEAIGQFGKNAGMKSTVIVGGGSYDDQKKALATGLEFVVGTPGRLLDLYKSHVLDLNGVGAIVFDEADRMFDMGFKDDMKFILRRVPRNRQFLLFSATLNFDVLNTAYQFGAEPLEFNVSRDQVTAEGIDHEIMHVGQEDKPMYLLSVLKKYSPQQCIVFSNFKHNVGRIAKFLKNNKIEAFPMSSLLSQAQRNKVLEGFRVGKKEILVATDVAARGLDIKGVDLVINYDMPDEAQGYVHRIGRTGRAGLQGRAVGLVSDRDVEALMRIEEYLKEKIKTGWLEEQDLIKEFSAFPRQEDEQRPFRPRQQRPRTGPPPRRPQGGSQSRPKPQGVPQVPHAPPVPAAPPKGAHGQTANSSHSAVANQHRDRRLGRHGGLPGLKQEGNTAGQQSGGQNPRHKQDHRNRHGGGQNQNTQQQQGSHRLPPRRPLRKGSDIKKDGAVGNAGDNKEGGLKSKVKGFFSKLFK